MRTCYSDHEVPWSIAVGHKSKAVQKTLPPPTLICLKKNYFSTWGLYLALKRDQWLVWAKAEDSPLLFRPYPRLLHLQAGRGAGQSRSPLPPHYSGVFPADPRSWAGLVKIKVSPGKVLKTFNTLYAVGDLLLKYTVLVA